MAIVYKYTVMYFTLMHIIHESTSSVINRDLCLETAARFVNDIDKCNFVLSTARSIFKDVTTCAKKCNIQIHDLYTSRYYLETVDLTIGNEILIIYPCSEPEGDYGKYLTINCSSWNAREYKISDDANGCFFNNTQCVYIYNYCICHCMPGYILIQNKCLKIMVNIGDNCEHKWQCKGTKFANVCDHGLCSCNPGYIQKDRKCYEGNMKLNDSCNVTEQCIQPSSDCFFGTCKCVNGYSAFDQDSCLKDMVPVGGICSLDEQCTGSNNSGVCEYGRCTCEKGFKIIDLECKKNHQTSLGSSNSQQLDTNIGVTLGTLFGGFILGVIVSAVVMTLMHRRLKFRTRKREEPDVMFADNRAHGAAEVVDSGAQFSYKYDKKQKVVKLSPYSFSKEQPGYNLSRKQEIERTEDVYNHLHEQTEQDDVTYDHARAAPKHSTDLSDYSKIRDITSVQSTSPSIDGGDYSTLGH